MDGPRGRRSVSRLRREPISTADRFGDCVENSVLKLTVIADSFRPVGAGDRIDDGPRQVDQAPLFYESH